MAHFNRRVFLQQSACLASSLTVPSLSFSIYDLMKDNNSFDVIIVGGSYSGLSAAMALGRALRRVLVIDSGKPCNRQTPHSHNYITHDGRAPGALSKLAYDQVKNYSTISFHQGIAIHGSKDDNQFTITTNKHSFKARKLIFATGVKDIMTPIPGFAECWGTSVIHCPYCHGYEVKDQKTGILANGEMAFHYAKLINNWTKDLTLYTNGSSTLTDEQISKIQQKGIEVIEKRIKSIIHTDGHMSELVFEDDSQASLKALYAKPNFEQHCKIPTELGCELNEQGLLSVDMFQKTNIQGVYACGDSASPLRAISYAVASGTIAGAVVNNDMIEEDF